MLVFMENELGLAELIFKHGASSCEYRHFNMCSYLFIILQWPDPEVNLCRFCLFCFYGYGKNLQGEDT